MTTPGNNNSHPAVFLLLSTLLHFIGVVVLAALAWEPLFVPRIQITWLDLDNQLGAPRPGPKARPRPSPAETKKAPPAKSRKPSRKAARRKVAMAKPDAGVSPTDAGAGTNAAPPVLSDLAPGDAALILVLRMDRIQGSPYEDSVRRLLQVFYDHKTLLWTSSGLDPVRDFETLLIATPNPYRVTRTFLAVRHRLPRHRIRRALERSVLVGNGRMRWSRLGKLQRGDIPSPPKLPRDPRVVLLGDGLVMLTDPNHVPLLSTDLSAPAPRPGSSGSSPDAGIRTGQGWLESLRRMNRTGGLGKKVPGMQLMAINLQRLVRLPPDIPMPHSFRVTIRATAPTTAHGDVLFDSEASARRFVQVIPKRIAKAKRSLLLRLLGVTDLLDGIRLKRDGQHVAARLKLSAKQVRSLLELFRGMIPQVRVPGMPPRDPPDAGPAARPDAGPAKTDAGPARTDR